MRYLRTGSLAAIALLLVGCSGTKITEIVVAVATDLDIPAELEVVQLRVAHPDARTDSGIGPWVIDTQFDVVKDAKKEKGIELPATIGLLPEGDPHTSVYVSITGLANKEAQLERTARLPFAVDRIILIHMNLLRNCLFKVKKCVPPYTCENGECVLDNIVPVYPCCSDAQADLPRADARLLDAGKDKSVVELGKDKSVVELGKDKSVVDSNKDVSVVDQTKDKIVDKPKTSDKTPDKTAVVDKAKDKTVVDKAKDKTVVVDLAKDKTVVVDLAKDKTKTPDLAKDTKPSVDAGCVQPTPVVNCSGGWCQIPAGCFSMGSPTTECYRDSDELLHQVTLTHAFEIQQYETTVTQWTAKMGTDTSYNKTCGTSCPVEYMTWHQAAAYCNELSKAASKTSCYACSGSGSSTSCSVSSAYTTAYYTCPGYRLPTEAEYEYATRANTSTPFYLPGTGCAMTDAVVGTMAWYYANSGTAKKAVGQKLQNGWGLYDISGNVWEWTSDEFFDPLSTSTDPFTPAVQYAVVRGGSFEDLVIALRSANRKKYDMSTVHYHVGFRCVRSTTGTN